MSFLLLIPLAMAVRAITYGPDLVLRQDIPDEAPRVPGDVVPGRGPEPEEARDRPAGRPG